MLFSKKRLVDRAPEELATSEKDEAIKSLERERQRKNLEIEEVLRKYANESGNRALKKRGHKFGSHPNDWNFKSWE